MTIDAFIGLLGARLGFSFTDEQAGFIEDFKAPMLSFSLPGTGKTATAIAGLLTAEKFYKIPGANIRALSFTRNATVEIKVRHEEACKLFGVQQLVKFQTLHSICRELLAEHYALIGIPKFRVVQQPSLETSISMIDRLCADNGIMLKKYQARKIFDAIQHCNNSFIFDRDNVEGRYAFRRCGITYDQFMVLRSQIYEVNRSAGLIPVGEIPLYALELLTENEWISKKFKETCKLMLVDEFQDLSLLQLDIIHYLCDNVIAIGDINQQIYEFNGACQEIVERFGEYYPNHAVRNLTHSFRCAPEIAEYSVPIIIRNRTNGENIKGLQSRKGMVRVTSENDIEDTANAIAAAFDRQGHLEKSIMFLYRNNFSAIPIAEMLYSKRVPFFVAEYKEMFKRGIISNLFTMMDFLNSPYMMSHLWILSKFIPEFKMYTDSTRNPLHKIMEETGMSFLDINYEYDDADIVQEVFEIFWECRSLLKHRAPVIQVIELLYKPFYENYLKYFEDKLETSPAEMLLALNCVCGNKSLQEFVFHEQEKAKFIEENKRRRFGVRCMTFHGAKGLEADIVHIYDADKGIIPNRSKLTDMVEEKCHLDVARQIRNERSLIYVACTRAKYELHIHYTTELSPIFTGAPVYERWDNLYYLNKSVYFDKDIFKEFIKGKWC